MLLQRFRQDGNQLTLTIVLSQTTTNSTGPGAGGRDYSAASRFLIAARTSPTAPASARRGTAIPAGSKSLAADSSASAAAATFQAPTPRAEPPRVCAKAAAAFGEARFMRANSVPAWRSNNASTSDSRAFSPKVIRVRWARSMTSAAETSVRPPRTRRVAAVGISAAAAWPDETRRLRLGNFGSVRIMGHAPELLVAASQTGRQAPRPGKRRYATGGRSPAFMVGEPTPRAQERPAGTWSRSSGAGKSEDSPAFLILSPAWTWTLPCVHWCRGATLLGRIVRRDALRKKWQGTGARKMTGLSASCRLGGAIVNDD